MRGIIATPVPETIEMLLPEQRAIRAAVYVTSGKVHFAPEVAEKTRRHPYNAITKPILGIAPPAVATASALGVLLALAPASYRGAA
jgi:hypothetical protein